MKMTKTIKTAGLRQPHNYWISRRVWADEKGTEYVKINGNYIEIDWLIMHGWEVDIVF